MKPFLILQLRPESKEAADGEFNAFLRFGGLKEEDVVRMDMTKSDLGAINLDDYSGVIVGGGASCIISKEKSDGQRQMEKELPKLLDKVIAADFPYIGACYGHCFIAQYAGGTIRKDRSIAEDAGAIEVTVNEAGQVDDLIKELPTTFTAFTAHKEGIDQLPPESVILAGNEQCPVQIIRVKNNIYGTQFHPELDAQGLIDRMSVYRHAGYFPPEDFDKIEAENKDIKVSAPMEILRRFVEKYKRTGPI